MLGFFVVAVLALGLSVLRGLGGIQSVPGLDAAPFDRPGFQPLSYVADDPGLPRTIAMKGSFIGGDGYQGRFVTGWYEARSDVTVMVAGYPRLAGNSLAVEFRSANGLLPTLTFSDPDPHERWMRWDLSIPPEATGFRIVAVDGSSAFKGWLAVSEPIHLRAVPSLSLLSRDARMLVTVLVQEALIVLLVLGLARVGNRLFPNNDEDGLIFGLFGVVLLGYLAFWTYFFFPLGGRVLSWAALVAAVGAFWRILRKRDKGMGGHSLAVIFALSAVIGLGYVSMTALFAQGTFSDLVAARFQRNLASDNTIPQLFSEKLWTGVSPKHLVGDWLSSDRPPLQTGFILLFQPVFVALGADGDTLGQGTGICFELLWVPFLWLFVRRLGAGVLLANAIVASVAFTGFELFHTVYTWPKMGAAALLSGAFLCWLAGPAGKDARGRFLLGGGLAGLAWLAHGGIAFSLVGLVPVALWLAIRDRRYWRAWLWALLAFGVISLPWTCYQKFYEPPGDRLLKWHLAGVVEASDTRPFLPTLITSYHDISWSDAWDIRKSNIRMQFWGDWDRYLRFAPATDVINRRWDETEFAARTFGWWVFGLAAIALVFLQKKVRATPLYAAAIGWVVFGWVAAILLMFRGTQATAHQGTMITQLVGFALLCWSAALISRWFFAVLSALQIVSFFLVWTAPTTAAMGSVDPLSATVGIAAAMALGGVVLGYLISPSVKPKAGPAA